MVQTTYTQGTTAIDKTRDADNKYQLNSIDGNTGWTLMSEMGKQVLVEDEFDTFITPPTTFPVDLKDSNHLANTNVFSNLNPWDILGSSAFWKINSNYLAYTANSAIIISNSIADCEIKMLIEANATSSTTHCGIIFRYLNSSSFWNFSIWPSATSGYLDVHFENPSGPLITPMSFKRPNSNMVVLKVKMKGSFISVYYNELLLLSVSDIANISSIKHGMRGNNNLFSVHSFNIIK